MAAALVLFPAAAEEIPADRLDALPPADVVILGEVHDNRIHHANQALAVEAVEPGALVFEMLTPAQALRVTPELRGNAAALGAAIDWDESGWPDFSMYHPIFTAAPSATVFGGALPRDEVRRAVTEGAAAVIGAAAQVFGIDRPLAAEEASLRETEQDQAHCEALPESLLPGMVEAQRLRDAALARAVIAAHAESGGPVALITGNGHARTDWGVPRLLAAAAPDLDVLSIGQLEAAPDAAPPFDLWVVTEPAIRDDPCAELR